MTHVDTHISSCVRRRGTQPDSETQRSKDVLISTATCLAYGHLEARFEWAGSRFLLFAGFWAGFGPRKANFVEGGERKQCPFVSASVHWVKVLAKKTVCFNCFRPSRNALKVESCLFGSRVTGVPSELQVTPPL